MLPANRARQVIIEACGRGPQSVAMLAAHMLNAGEDHALIYATVRIHLPNLIDERRIETVTLTNGECIYRLPAHASFEPRTEE